MMRWIYRYIFRGIGVVLLVGMLTILGLAIATMLRREVPPLHHGYAPTPHASVRRAA